jgi:hypothetical protein
MTMHQRSGTESRIHNPGVGGSSPLITTSHTAASRDGGRFPLMAEKDKCNQKATGRPFKMGSCKLYPY